MKMPSSKTIAVTTALALLAVGQAVQWWQGGGASSPSTPAPAVTVSTTVEIDEYVKTPKSPVLVGEFADVELSSKVGDPQWQVDPDTQTRRREGDRTLSLSTNVEGRYVVFAAGLVDGKVKTWRIPIIVSGGVPTVAPPTKPTLPPATPAPSPTVPVAPVAPVQTVTAAVYVYDYVENGSVPSEVLVGLNRLNLEKKIRATNMTVETPDGEGEIPEQYKIPYKVAKEKGLPGLVLLAGDVVVDYVKDPKTADQVFNAVK
jgi:hypothetical protein